MRRAGCALTRMPCKADSEGQLRLRFGAAGGSIGPLFGGATDLWRLSALLLQNSSQRPTPRALARLDQAQDWAADAIRENARGEPAGGDGLPAQAGRAGGGDRL